MNVSLRSRLFLLPLALACLLPAGCGGGGSDAPVTASTTSISGTVTAGPVDGCQLAVLDDTGNIVAGPVLSSSQGAFTVKIPKNRLGEALVFASSGGNYTDEATGDLTSAGTLSAQLEADTLGAGVAVHLTPGSTVIHQLMAAGLSRSEAETAFAGAFGYTPDPLVAPNLNGDGSEEENLAGLRAGAFSYLTADLGQVPAEQFDLLTAVAEDLAADGTLDGAGAVAMALPEDTANHFAASLIAQGNAMGLSANQLGTLPFAKVAETTSYRIEYQVGMMGAMQGKTIFKLGITDLDSGDPVTGASPELSATMAMASMSHGTPIDGCSELGGGIYQCTVYYLMASTMNGSSAGYWSLAVTANGETATFYPEVMMAMGDTARATLKDADDKIAGMMGQPAQVRSYYLFKDSLTGVTGAHGLSLFLATRESMMSHPALVVGMDLHDENGVAWTVDTVTVQLSDDDGSTWLPMTDNGGGHWSVSGITNLAQGVAGTLLVRLSVNGVEKTTTGAADGAPASFTVTPK